MGRWWEAGRVGLRDKCRRPRPARSSLRLEIRAPSGHRTLRRQASKERLRGHARRQRSSAVLSERRGYGTFTQPSSRATPSTGPARPRPRRGPRDRRRGRVRIASAGDAPNTRITLQSIVTLAAIRKARGAVAAAVIASSRSLMSLNLEPEPAHRRVEPQFLQRLPTGRDVEAVVGMVNPVKAGDYVRLYSRSGVQASRQGHYREEVPRYRFRGW